MSDLKFYSKAKQDDQCPDGMSVYEWKKLKEAKETERYLARNESVRVPVPDNDELNLLFRRGELLRASELEAKKKAEQQSKEQFEQAVELESRNQRYQQPRQITKNTTPIWTREPVDD